MIELMKEQHSAGESQEADAHGAFLRPAIQDFLKRVGIAPEMRVLVVGGEIGVLAPLAAEMVGPKGEVIAVDRAEPTVSLAAARAQAEGLTNVRFAHRDLDRLADLASSRPFDAAISRQAIVYHAKPVEAVQNLIRLVRPGGVVGFQEVDLAARYWSTHKLETLDRFYEHVERAMEENRIAKDLSSAMFEAFVGAGIVERRLIRTGATETSPNASVYEWIGAFARALASALSSPESGPPDFGKSFEARLRSEVESKGATFIPFHFVGAAGHLPAPATDAAKN